MVGCKSLILIQTLANVAELYQSIFLTYPLIDKTLIFGNTHAKGNILLRYMMTCMGPYLILQNPKYIQS